MSAPANTPARDLAIAEAIRQSAPGETVIIHAEDCRITRQDQRCTCEPLRLKIGAKA